MHELNQKPSIPTSQTLGKSHGSKIMLFIFVAITILIAFGMYVLGANKTQAPVADNVIPQVSVSPTDETANPDSIGANWKTYSSNEGKFTFKHPQDWYFKTAQENYGTNYKGARVEILFSNKLDKNGKIPSGVNIDRSTAHGLIAVNGCQYASGCDEWTNESKFYDIKSPHWQGGGGPYPLKKLVSLSELGGKNAVLIKSEADTNAVAYNGEYSIQYNVLLENKERLTLSFAYNNQNQDNDQILKTFDQILSTFQFTDQ